MIKARLDALMFGTVIDNNVTNASPEEVRRLLDEMGQEGFFKDYEMRKEPVDRIEVKKLENKDIVVALEARGKLFSYNFGRACLKQTIGGLGYNVFQNLSVLNNSFYRYLEILMFLQFPTQLLPHMLTV